MICKREVKKCVPFYKVKHKMKNGLTESVIEQKRKGIEHG